MSCACKNTVRITSSRTDTKAPGFERDRFNGCFKRFAQTLDSKSKDSPLCDKADKMQTTPWKPNWLLGKRNSLNFGQGQLSWTLKGGYAWKSEVGSSVFTLNCGPLAHFSDWTAHVAQFLWALDVPRNHNSSPRLNPCTDKNLPPGALRSKNSCSKMKPRKHVQFANACNNSLWV